MSRKSLHYDFNADGYQDIFFAINREDGRSGRPPETNNAFSAAILSVKEMGSMKSEDLGVENWYHSIGIVPNTSGVEVWLGGLSKSSGQFFNDTNVTLASGFGYKLGNTQTSLSPVIQVLLTGATFTAIPNVNNIEDTRQIVSVVDLSNGLGAGLGLFTKGTNNEWMLTSTNFPILPRR